MFTKGGLGLLLLSCSLFPANQAKASIVAVLSNASAGNTFIYDINFLNTTDAGTGLPSERVDAAGTGVTSFVTVYDLFGVTSITLAPAFASKYSLSTQFTGVTPLGTAPVDSPTLINFTVTYIGGATITTPFSDAAVVAVVSSSATRGSSFYTGQDTKNAGGATGTQAANIGQVTVPVSPVPEPATMFLLGGSLLGLGALSRRKFKA